MPLAANEMTLPVAAPVTLTLFPLLSSMLGTTAPTPVTVPLGTLTTTCDPLGTTVPSIG